MSLRLYELTDAYRMLLEAEEDSGAGSFEEALYQLGGEISTKAESLAKVARSLEAESDAIDAEIKRLREKKDSRDTRVMWIKDYLRRNMETAGLERINGTLFSVTLQNSPPRCDVVAQGDIEANFMKLVPASYRVDAQAIVAHWKLTGEQVPGAVVSQSRHIRIR